MSYFRASRLAAIGSALIMAAPLPAEPPGRITGIGGIFVKSPDPKALMAWYRDVLGMKIETWGGALFPHGGPAGPTVATFNAFHQSTDYMDPSKREFMINFTVDNLPVVLERLKAKGVTVLKRDDTDPSGRFAWIVDPDGTKIELWEASPKK